MNSISPARRGAAAVAAVVAGLAGAVATSPTTAEATPAPAARAVPKTTITFEMPGCDGCEVRLEQGRWDDREKWGIDVWRTAKKTVEDGAVTYTVPSKRTRGMSMTVVAPWEGHTGYLTTVVFRYAGHREGDEVRFRDARSRAMASACWAGTSAGEATIPLTVRKVWVEGQQKPRVHGSIAYADVTQDWMVPMRQVWDGVMGSQETNICGER